MDHLVGTAAREAPTGRHDAPQRSAPDDAERAAAWQAGRRRFTIAVVVAAAVALVPYLWVLWGHHLDPFRTAWNGDSFSNFYDLQGRALLHGRLYVPKGSLSIEAFVVDGKQYMYFGPFSAILRLPILALTNRFDGGLTAPSMLLAWLVTALFTSLSLWRVRLLIRGPATVTRGEAATYGVFVATILSGSVLLYLATMPWVYSEDFAWGAALGIGAFFAVLGVLESPTRGRVTAACALAVAAALARTTTGWACVIAVLLAAAWFGLGRGGAANRRWCRPLVIAGLVPLAIGCIINWAKFRMLFGVDMRAQVFTQLNAHRRAVLAAHGGRLWSPTFLPSTAWAYLRPDGLRLTSVYPFITLPAAPARSFHVVLDQTYRTGSMTATMPLLFLLAVWGLITAFRPRAPERAHLVRVPLVAAALATAGVLLWGYIAHRYLAEFIPLLVLAGGVGLTDLWRRAGGRGRQIHRLVLGGVAALGVFGVVANLLIASAPPDAIAWQGARAQNYVKLQRTFADLTGQDLADRVRRGTRLPSWAPADQLFVVGNCSGLYVSTGDRDHPWMTAETQERDLVLTLHQPPRHRLYPIATIGTRRVAELFLESGDRGQFHFVIYDTYSGRNLSTSTPTKIGRPYRIGLTIDLVLNELSIAVDGHRVLAVPTVADSQLVTPSPGAAASAGAAPVTLVAQTVPPPKLCRSLIGQRT